MSKTTEQIKETSTGVKIFIFAAIGLVVILVVGMLMVMGSGASIDNTPTAAGEIIENGKQIITINTKGGYSPNNITAKAGPPAILRFATKNTFDCSTAVVIKQLNISKNLPANGNTDIEIPTQASGTTIKGACSMGMYSFEVKFI